MIGLATALLVATVSLTAQDPARTPETPASAPTPRRVQTPDPKQLEALADGLREMMRLDQLHRTKVSWGTTDPEEIAQLETLDDDAHLEEVRRRWKAGICLPKEQEAELMGKQQLLDKANFDQLLTWTKTFGYPDPERLGIDAPTPVPVLIHAQLEWFDPVLELLRAEAMAGRMPAREFAALYDRKEQHAGRVQLYGMCSVFDRASGQVLPPEIVDIAATNRARAALGMEPLEEYRILQSKRGDDRR